MASRPATFTQADVQRAFKAARAVDPALEVVIARDGTITIRRGEKPAPQAVDADTDWSF